MKAIDIPSYFPKPFADSAGSGYINPIPTASQIGITDGAASLTDGFPPLTFTPKASGGVPPFGADFNGILNQTTAVARWIQAGGLSVYDATFSTAIGGYPSGAVLVRADGGGFWISTADDNTTDPDTGGAGWDALGKGRAAPTGFVRVTPNLCRRSTAYSWTSLSIGIDTTIAAPSGATHVLLKIQHVYSYVSSAGVFAGAVESYDTDGTTKIDISESRVFVPSAPSPSECFHIDGSILVPVTGGNIKIVASGGGEYSANYYIAQIYD